jgi:uncharacterized membrane protein SirB2
LKQFADWLSTTSPSVFIQNNNGWAIPAIQTVHIVGIALVLGSVLMMNLRILGWAGTDQTVRQTTNRFGPWLNAALGLLLVTGILLIIGEPVRELMTFSFWLKMTLLAISICLTALFQMRLRKHRDEAELNGGSLKLFAIVTLLMWASIIVLGRLIAYDHVWGSWSPGSKV